MRRSGIYYVGWVIWLVALWNAPDSWVLWGVVGAGLMAAGYEERKH